MSFLVFSFVCLFLMSSGQHITDSHLPSQNRSANLEHRFLKENYVLIFKLKTPTLQLFIYSFVSLIVFIFLFKSLNADLPHSPLILCHSPFPSLQPRQLLCDLNMSHSRPPLDLCTAAPSAKCLHSSLHYPDTNPSVTSSGRPSLSVRVQDPFPILHALFPLFFMLGSTQKSILFYLVLLFVCLPHFRMSSL